MRHENSESDYLHPWEMEDGKVPEATLSALRGHPRDYKRYMQWYCWDDIECIKAVHTASATRAIIAAAQGGHLRRLDPGDRRSRYQFQIRALLPCWVRIEDWSASREKEARWSGPGFEWTAAAVYLRRFLAHASYQRDWLGTRLTSSTAVGRSLKLEDLQAVHSHFQEVQVSGDWHSDKQYQGVVVRYLPWLIEDETLAQEVLAVWNSIVERGEADTVKCPYMACNGL